MKIFEELLDPLELIVPIDIDDLSGSELVRCRPGYVCITGEES